MSSRTGSAARQKVLATDRVDAPPKPMGTPDLARHAVKRRGKGRVAETDLKWGRRRWPQGKLCGWCLLFPAAEMIDGSREEEPAMPYAVMTPTIGIAANGEIQFAGPDPSDYRHAIVARINEAVLAGRMPTEADLAEIDGLPVLREKDVEACCLSVEYRKTF